MLEWVKQFLILPLSYLAAMATIIWIAVEILTLTTWGLIMKTRKAAHGYYRIVSPPSPDPISGKTVAIIAAAVLVTFYVVRKGQSK